MRRRMAGAAALLVMASIVPTVALAPTPARAAVDDAHRLYVMSDSVVLGAKDALPRAFPGWQVTVAGRPAVFTDVAATEVPADAALVGDVAVVATGYNYPYWDPARFDRSVDTMVANLLAAGAKRVVWVTLREVKPEFVSASAWAGVQPYYWYFPTVNEHLRDALDRHPELSLADWAAVADEPGLTYDAIHLNATGARRMAELIRSTVEGYTRVAAGTELRVKAATGDNGVPVGAEAVALTVTATDAAGAGFLTVHPCGTVRPLASNLNVAFGRVVANHVIAGIGVDEEVCVYASVTTHVVVDVAGYVMPGRSITPTVGRVLDTRDAEGTTGGRRLAAGEVATVTPEGRPADAVAAIVNLTAVDGAASGFLTLYPCGGAPPLASNVNHAAGEAVPNLAVAKLGADGSLCVYSKAAAHVVMDVLGWITGTGATSIVPTRLVDTRDRGTRVSPDNDLVVDVGRAGAVAGGAALVNVTLTDSLGDGYATAYPCAAGAPLASDVNVGAGATAAGLVVATVDDAGTVCVHVSSPAHVVVDLAGWMDPSAGYWPIVPRRLRDTRTDPRPF